MSFDAKAPAPGIVVEVVFGLCRSPIGTAGFPDFAAVLLLRCRWPTSFLKGDPDLPIRDRGVFRIIHSD